MTEYQQLPDVLDWVVVRGDDLEFTVQLSTRTAQGGVGSALDLTGAAVSADVKADREDTIPLASFLCTLLPQNVLATKGQVRLYLDALTTAKLPANVPCYYDLQVKTASRTRTHLTGTITWQPDVTRG